jgi:alkylated DNA repair dioxygenase AlkB
MLADSKKITVPNGWIYFEEHFISMAESELLFDKLKSELNWEQSTIKIFGKEYQTPRKESYYGETLANYAYSGKRLFRNDWNELLFELKLKIEQEIGHSFNAVLANWYRDGRDSNGWHADDEKELGKNPKIASLSFGCTRRFDLKHKNTNEKLSLELTTGSLLVMGGELQHFWKHQIPKQLKIKDDRINLTFRLIV